MVAERQPAQDGIGRERHQRDHGENERAADGRSSGTMAEIGVQFTTSAGMFTR
jgi:hypothetical protein